MVKVAIGQNAEPLAEGFPVVDVEDVHVEEWQEEAERDWTGDAGVSTEAMAASCTVTEKEPVKGKLCCGEETAIVSTVMVLRRMDVAAGRTEVTATCP